MNVLLEQIKGWSLEDQVELADVLASAKETVRLKQYEKPAQVIAKPRPRGPRGEILTDEQVWDAEHPLLRTAYGFHKTETDMNGKTKRINYSKKEIDAMNKPAEDAWIAEKRKLFPDAVIPPNEDIGAVQSRYQTQDYTRPDW